MRKNIFTMRVLKYQNRFAQRSCGFSAFWRYSKPDWTHPGQPPLDKPA